MKRAKAQVLWLISLTLLLIWFRFVFFCCWFRLVFSINSADWHWAIWKKKETQQVWYFCCVQELSVARIHHCSWHCWWYYSYRTRSVIVIFIWTLLYILRVSAQPYPQYFICYNRLHLLHIPSTELWYFIWYCHGWQIVHRLITHQGNVNKCECIRNSTI